MVVKTKTLRPFPDNRFEIIQIDDKPTRSIDIGANLPSTLKKGLFMCLNTYADLFAICLGEMKNIDTG